MFLDIYFHSPLQIDRDEIEEALEDYLGERGEVVGGGSGIRGSNIDLEIEGNAAPHLEPIKQILRKLKVPRDTTIVIKKKSYPVYD
jgi:hypothetical protein